MKNRYVAALLAFFLGGLGVHKFYLGKWTGIFYLALCWTYIPSIIALVEAILAMFSKPAIIWLNSFSSGDKTAVSATDFTGSAFRLADL